MDVSYISACREINPRLEKEIQERERRIKELFRRMSNRDSFQDDGNESEDKNDEAKEDEVKEDEAKEDDDKEDDLVKNMLDDDKEKEDGKRILTIFEERHQHFDISFQNRPPSAALCASGTVVNTENIVVPHSLPPQSLDNDQKVTLEIRGDRFVEHGDTMRYEDTNGRRHQMIPVKLSSIKYRRPQKITLELRSAGPLIGQAVKEESLLSTHTIEVRQTKSNNTPSCQQVYTTQTKQTYHSPDEHSIQKNFKEVLIVIDNVNAENDDSSDAEQQQPNMRILPQTDL